MSEYHVPKGVSPETLSDIVVGWAAVGAAAEPSHTADVAEATGISDAVGRQTRFLEGIGVLDSEGKRHRLTDVGQSLAAALLAENDDVAAERARSLLLSWGLTEEVCAVLRSNPMTESDLMPVVAVLAGQDEDHDRVRSGIGTLLSWYEWAGVLTESEDGYRVADGVETGEDSAGNTASLETLTAALSNVEAVEQEESGTHALSLGVDIDADPAELEAIVAAVRRGLVED